ncbi:LexA family protein [Streptomyces sp. NPDC002076]
MHRVEHLTHTQKRILRCIRQAIADPGEAPTVQEIGDTVGMRSQSSVLLCTSPERVVRGIRFAKEFSVLDGPPSWRAGVWRLACTAGYCPGR